MFGISLAVFGSRSSHLWNEKVRIRNPVGPCCWSFGLRVDDFRLISFMMLYIVDCVSLTWVCLTVSGPLRSLPEHRCRQVGTRSNAWSYLASMTQGAKGKWGVLMTRRALALSSGAATSQLPEPTSQRDARSSDLPKEPTKTAFYLNSCNP